MGQGSGTTRSLSWVLQNGGLPSYWGKKKKVQWGDFNDGPARRPARWEGSCRSSLAAEVTPPCGLAVTWCHLVARSSERHAVLSLWDGHLSKGSITCGCSTTSQGCPVSPRMWLHRGLVKATSKWVVGTPG